jgi:hypothetical protein
VLGKVGAKAGSRRGSGLFNEPEAFAVFVPVRLVDHSAVKTDKPVPCPVTAAVHEACCMTARQLRRPGGGGLLLGDGELRRSGVFTAARFPQFARPRQALDGLIQPFAGNPA